MILRKFASFFLAFFYLKNDDVMAATFEIFGIFQIKHSYGRIYAIDGIWFHEKH